MKQTEKLMGTDDFSVLLKDMLTHLSLLLSLYCKHLLDYYIYYEIKVQCLNTKSMVADYLTKPLVGELFYKLRDLLLGYATL